MLDATQSGEVTDSALNSTLSRLLASMRMDRTWERAEGVWVTDASGRRFLDCYAQYGALALGHNPAAVRASLLSALEEREPALVQPYRARYAEALAQVISQLAPGDLCCGMFLSSGAEAVEAAVKLVRAYTRRPVILSCTGSFHGKTLGALAVTGQQHYADGFGPMPPDFEHVAFGDAEALETKLEGDGEHIAAFFVEPIQGERGVFLPPAGYLKRVRELCSRYEVLLVLDEIQTGLGRTGRLFACEEEEIAPDVLLIGKALGGGLFPLSGCFTTTDYWDDRFALSHSSTFANHNLACRVGLTVMEELTQGGLCVQAAERGEYLHQRLEQLAARYPRVVSAVRSRGLMGAMELAPPREDEGTLLSFLTLQGLYAYAVAATIAETASVLVLPTLGEADVIRVAPALSITETELKQAS